MRSGSWPKAFEREETDSNQAAYIRTTLLALGQQSSYG